VDDTHGSNVSERVGHPWLGKGINKRRVEHGWTQNSNTQWIVSSISSLMSGYTNFAVIGAGNFGIFIIQQLLKDKAAGTVKEIVVLTRQVKHPTNNSAVRDVLSTVHLLWTFRDPNGPFRATPK
jgi:hypothetical protein